MSMQVVYGLIHAAHQLQSQLSLPILMPAITWTVMCAVLVDGLLMVLTSTTGRPSVIINNKQGATQDGTE